MRRLLTAASLVVTAALTARAQCPDGTPPPCRTRSVPQPAAAARRPNPRLDDGTWIVLPFDNLARTADVDWLRDASVNLLYLDLSKWSDIQVVDDERVADLLREVPEAQGGKQLSLNAGLAVARRAGAGRLVMGDLLKVGTGTTVTAKVFDVRNGIRIRTVRQDSPVQDSLMPTFGRLARGILNVAPPAGANVGTIGTSNTAAYHDYLAGVNALNRFDLTPARRAFEAALGKDSSFALAHYKLAVLIGWENASDESKADHARAAARFSGALPARERTLVNALVAFDNQEYGRACALYGSLVHSDSTDVEALYGMGECLFHDNVVEPVGGDTTRLRYRGSHNAAIRVFRRTLDLDPTYHLAFQHILDAYVADGRQGCRLKDTTATKVESAATSCADTYTTVARLDGDSLLMVPVSSRDGAALAAQSEAARLANMGQAKLKKARAIAEEWVAAGPSEPRALTALTRIQLLLGDVDAADATLSRARIADLDDNERGRAALSRIEIALKSRRDSEFVRDVDSIAATRPAGQGATVVAISRAILGRMASYDSTIGVALRTTRVAIPPIVALYLRSAPRVVMGAAPDSIAASERATFDFILGVANRRTATTQIAPTLEFGFRLPRPGIPPIDSSYHDHRLAPMVAFAHKDTAALRRAAITLDSIARAAGDNGSADDGSATIATDAYLALGDSVAALACVRRFLNSGIAPTPMFAPLGGAFTNAAFLWPRAMLLRADLEAAIGTKNDARAFYRRFLTLWSRADPEFQPIVDRARRSLAALGPG